MSPTKRLRSRRAHHRERQDAERLSLAPLTFEQAVKGALKTKPPKTDAQDEDEEAKQDS
jgi:hypothetical protein